MNRRLVTLLLVLGAVGADVGTGAAAPGGPSPVASVGPVGPAGPAGKTARSTATVRALRLRVAQAPDPVAAASAEVARAERTRGALVTQRATLEQRYEAQTAEIEKLKRQRASWRRDRALKPKLAASKETSDALVRLARDIADADAELRRARARAVTAIDAALPGATGARLADLSARRRAWAPSPRVKKIVIPDDELDPLADPEDLDQQAAALAATEAELQATIARFDTQATRFDHQATLRRQHSRAEEMVARDDVDPRPGVAGAGGTALEGAADAPEPTDDVAGVGGEAAAFDRDATSLSAVIDAGTIDGLRSAGRSNDPARRADATRAARQAVAARLARLQQQRSVIEARARDLRKHR